MKFGIIVFPGSNCDEDIYHVLREILQQETIKLWHKDKDLQGCDFIVVPGGFSYGDYLRSGAIARFSPIMEAVMQHAQRGGYVLGICNGFQILTEAHLLPGVLLRNIEQRFICKNVFLKPVSQTALMTTSLDRQRAYQIPIAHADGRYYASDEQIKQLEDNDQILFRYCNAQGEVDEVSNCNGSIHSIAGITNKNKNVFGLMPHPERAADQALGNIDGRLLLETFLKETYA